jgi:hypothetical protein
MHRLSAGRTGRPPLLAEATGPFQAELPAADLADVSFLAIRGFPVPVNGIGSAAGQKTPLTDLRFIFLCRYVCGHTAGWLRFDPMQMNVSDTVCILLLCP